MATGQLYYLSSEKVYSYNPDIDETTKILELVSFGELSQFCINHKKGEMYLSGFDGFSQSATIDLEGRKIFVSEIVTDISSFSSTAMILDERTNLIYSTRGGAVEMHFNENGYPNSESIISGSDIHGLALDTTSNKIYYSDRGTNRIYRANLDGTEIEEIIYLASGLADPRGIFLDLKENKIYWANTGQKKIQRANLDGSEIENVVLGLDKPENISFSAENNILLITDIGAKAIFSYTLDSNILDTLIMDNSINPSSIEFDEESQFLYWIDEFDVSLSRIDIKTKENTGILVLVGAHENAIAIDELQGFIFLMSDNQISRFKLDGSYGINIRKESLLDSKAIAIDILTEDIYYVYDLNFIRKTNYDGSFDLLLYEQPDLFPETINNLFFDGLNNTLYWLEAGNIYKSDPDNFSKEIFLDYDEDITLFALDFINSKIYFRSGNLVYFSNFDGSASEPIIGTSILHMVVDPIAELLYYSNGNGIFTSALNGYFEQEFITGQSVKKFTFGSTDGYLVLPIVDADALVSGNNINLTWTVSSDFNGLNSSVVVLGNFEIEKRSDDGPFENIGSVEFIEGMTSYSFVDEDPKNGKNEYRLMYYSTDSGLTSYSKYFSTVFTTTSTENIVEEQIFYYDFRGSKFVNNGISGSLNILSMEGRKVYNSEIDSNNELIEVPNLQPGIYIYLVQGDNKKRIEGKFVKM